MKIPFLSTNNRETEEKILNNMFFIKHDQWRYNSYKDVKEIRNPKMPQYYYTDNLKDDSDINKNKKEHDKTLLNYINDCIVNGHPEKSIDLFDNLLLAKSKELAITLATSLDEGLVAQILTNKHRLSKLQEEQSTYNNISESAEKQRPTPQRLNGHANNRNGYVNSYTEMNPLSSIALNLDTFKDLEDEVRNEMGNIYEDDKNNTNFEDCNSMNTRINNLEKKNVSFLFNFLESSILQGRSTK